MVDITQMRVRRRWGGGWTMAEHGGPRSVEAIMIGECLSVNRQKPTYDNFLMTEHRADMQKPPEGGSNQPNNLVDLSCYRRQPTAPENPVNYADDPILVFLRYLAPGVDDRRLSGVLDRIAGAWRSACLASGAFDDIGG